MRQIRFVLLPVAVVALAAAAAGCGGGGNSVPGGSVAKVGDQDISKQDFDNLMSRAKTTFASQHRPFPKQGTQQYKTLQSQAVQFLVQKAEYRQEADKLGISISQKQIDDRLKQVIKQYFGGNQKKYEQQLKKQGLTQSQVEQDIKDQLISQALFDKVTSDVKVTPQDVTNYYNTHKQQYTQPESRTVRHILISVCGPNAPGGQKCLSDAKAKALADQLYNRIKGGADFAALAKKYSNDPGSASQGGKLTITRGQTVPTFDQTAFLLGVGTVSHPVKTQYGYHIIEPISQTKPAHQTPLSQVRSAIEQQLVQSKKQQAMATWVKDVQKNLKVTYAAGYEPPKTTTTTSTNGG
jgi:parvulin-like peptidyl-prolyl isomerase